MALPPQKDLSIILPAYEEADNLRWLLPEIKSQLQDLEITYEVIVVDTEQPKDESPQICAINQVIYIPRVGGSLYSHALKTGIGCSSGKWILCMDSDGSHPASFIASLWGARNEADIIIASRYVKGGHTENPAPLIFLSYLVNVVFRLVLGLKCSDLSNSFRLYQGAPLRSLTLECQNFDIVEEILLKISLAKAPFTIREIPFTFEARKSGKTKRDLFAFILSYLGTLRRLYKFKKDAIAKTNQLGSNTLAL